MTLSGTVFEVLATPNPRLDLSKQPHGVVTKNIEYKPLDPTRVSKWEDFTFGYVKAAYGHLFDLGPVHSIADPRMEGTPTEIEKEAHVDILTSKWNYEICKQPLKVAGAQILKDIGQPHQDITMQQQGAQSHDAKSNKRPLAPDWVVYLRGASKTILIWGDSKCSSKWRSNMVRMDNRERQNWIWPFRQVLSYCVNENVRYGYIFTPEEMVLLRVSYDDNQGKNFKWGVEYHAIPWDQGSTAEDGEDLLTVNLGLWALVMSSLNTTYRPIVREQDVLPLNTWWVERDRTGRIIYKHHLSGHTTDKLPANAIAKNRPAMPVATASGSSDARSQARNAKTAKRSTRSGR